MSRKSGCLFDFGGEVETDKGGKMWRVDGLLNRVELQRSRISREISSNETGGGEVKETEDFQVFLSIKHARFLEWRVRF